VDEVAYLLDLVVGVKVDDVTKGLLQSCNVFFHDVRVRERKVEGGVLLVRRVERETKKKKRKKKECAKKESISLEDKRQRPKT
jgi:hypothetical protein